MTGLFSALIDYMEEEAWKYEILEGETILRFHFKGSSGRLLCYAEVDEEKFWLIFYAYMPVNTPPEKMDEMAEFICRANRGMRIGNFELDYDDGEIRYKTSIDAEGGELTHSMIDNLLRANLSTINRYFPGIMSVIYSDKEVLDQAIEALADATFKEHASKKRAITEFRMSLASLLDVIKKHKKDMKLPLFIFIDELDRCRPNFAVEVLEVVKHLFDVPGVYFVIATHIDQLAASINVLYGEKFDSRQYLKRFFQQEYVLPSPEPMKFIQYLYQQYRPLATLPEHRLFVLFENASFLNPPAPPREIAQEVEVFLCLAKAFNLSLRDMEQAMVMLKAICLTWKKERQMHLCYLLFWIMLRQKNAEIFTQIVEADHDDALRDLIKGCMSDKPTIAVNNTKPMSIATIISYYYERRYWTDRAWTENAEKGRLNWHHLPDAIGLALNKELRNELSVPNTTFIFSHYPALVEQAGQLHI